MADKVLSPEAFVKLWQQSQSIAEFVAASGMTENAAYVRASRYRAKGVPLKKFLYQQGSHRKINWAALKELAKEMGSAA